MTISPLRHVRSAATSLVHRIPTRPTPLADPPAGSGLLPVMGDSGAPLIGHTLGVFDRNLDWTREGRARYGDIWWTRLVGNRIVMVVGSATISDVLANRDKAFGNKDAWGRFINPFFERGVMLMDFEEHLYHRRLLQQAFTKSRLADYLEQLNPVIRRNLESMPAAGVFEMYPKTKQITLDVANEVFAGVTLGAETESVDRAFIDSVHATTAIVRANLPVGAYGRGMRGRAQLERFFRELIPQRRVGDGADLLSVLCRAVGEEGERLTDDDIANHMIFLMMAAHETTAITMATMTYFMAKYPQWQERARAESIELGKEYIDYADMERLSTLDLILKESLRMYPPVGFQARMALRDTEIDGRYIPDGTIVFLATYASHRTDPCWTNPDAFDPERFSEERREDKVHRNAWAPFGSGVHKCIGMYFGGMEVIALMHQLLLKYEWTVPAGYEMPLDFATGPFPADGLPIRLRSRGEFGTP
ncbi:cytochrome P450 [Mycolicibacterium llatzerense]|uniref:cytochrome P450 n=1 Tax=Mycolicibacterium llatzerense TaxID=280871 RepID=UPI0021B653E5|nr:cytochrome P450 [Mycolicibacterium llatzerense]MCT7365854.1 cytochrome P450 [Mycolicibacterium llatzerense]